MTGSSWTARARSCSSPAGSGRRRGRIPAVVHRDGSARVQTVSRSEAPRFHRLLEVFGELTGVPVLLNTSFNLRGEPIVCNPSQALEDYRRSGLDALVINDCLLEKKIGERRP